MFFWELYTGDFPIKIGMIFCWMILRNLTPLDASTYASQRLRNKQLKPQVYKFQLLKQSPNSKQQCAWTCQSEFSWQTLKSQSNRLLFTPTHTQRDLRLVCALHCLAWLTQLPWDGNANEIVLIFQVASKQIPFSSFQSQLKLSNC